MYEMYPDAWMATEDDRQQQSHQPPRRRARKKHSVQPSVITRHIRALSDNPQAG